MTGQQLKNSILQMAVQGKLVPQDPNDEPASVLLERIRKEKEQLVKEGKIKKEKNPSYIFRGADNLPYEKVGKNDPVCIADEVPFEIPESWEWVRLGSIGDWGSGATPSRAVPEYYDGDIPWLKTGDLNDGYIKYIPESISKLALEKTSVRLNPTGSILIAMYGATIGKVGILTFPATTNQACCACLPIEIFNEYLFYFLMSQKVAFVKQGEGGAQPNISKEKIVATLMPLPPLAEQYRIVAKIKELFPLVKKYKEAYSAVSSLNNSFPDLLKKSILQEAVQGKLVPQDPSDEPASVLLERIRAEKERLIQEGKIKRDKHESIIYRRDNSHYEKLDGIERCIDDEIPFEIPETWEWCRLKTVGITQTGNTPSKAHPEYIGDEIPFITPGDIQNGTVFYDNQALSMEGKMVARICPKGSILQVCIGGSIGKAAIINKKVCFNQQINSISPIIIYSEYIYTIMQSPYFLKNIKKQAGGTATPIINRGIWDYLLIPIAPISEQNRIVEKQRELFDKISLN
jgi:type I restriction enzyme S subunit